MKDLVEKSRLKMDLKPCPTYSLIDSQSVKKLKKADGRKKIKEPKRHIVTDTKGHLLRINIHKANIHNTVGGCEVFKEALEKYPTLEGVCVDKRYWKTFKLFIQDVLKRTVTICPGVKNQWMILLKRWILERTFAWLNHFKRLSKDYEITKRDQRKIIS